MIPRWIIRCSEILITGTVLSLALVTSGNCQSVPNSEAAPEAGEEIEEIQVYGHKSLLHLRLDIYEAEDAYFDLFNSLNSDDDYDIHCYLEAQTGTRLRRRMCKTQYMVRLEAEATAEWVGASRARPGQSYLDPRARVRRLDALVQEEMGRLIAENPEFVERLNEYRQKKQLYESERIKRCEGRLFLCREPGY